MDSLEETLIGLEEKSWQANIKEDVDYFRKNTTDSMLVVAPFGVFDKQAIIAQIEKKQGVPFKSAKMEDTRVISLTPDSALITYKVAIVAFVQGKDVTVRRYVTTVYVRQKGKWLSAFSQHSDIK